jgi:hypothetical protein
VNLDGRFLYGTPLEKIIVRPVQAGEREVVAGGGGDDSREMVQPLEELSVKALACVALVLRLRKGNRRGPDAGGVEARRHLREPMEASEEKDGPRRKNDGECDLGGHEKLARSRA